ncbi:MAG TPA: methionyl-tRNA formyltransferase [Patescibacteria group bacterium]|nr:methionyl-tRNA formyltransferase [Patescibacteria group bacterium]
MKIVFFGSSKYSVIDEKAFSEKIGLSLVVTLPDRTHPKTKQLLPNPVKKYAAEQKIPVITTEKLTPDIVDQIKKIEPDFLVVADYGLILPKNLLQLPKKAAINVHHSLLPKYRGPAPVPFALLNGEQTVGVTIILMTPTVDAGDILAQEKYSVEPEDTTDSILTKLNELGSQLAIKVVENFDEYFQKRTPQNESQATFTHFMKKDDGFVSEKTPKEQIQRMIHAYFPWPGVWTKAQIKNKETRIKLLPSSSHPELDSGSSHCLIQIEGKKPVTYKDFINGYAEGKEILQKLGLI